MEKIATIPLVLMMTVASVSSSFSSQDYNKKISISLENCEENICAHIKYVNKSDRDICVIYSKFPHGGIFIDDIFEVRKIKTNEKAKYIGIKSHGIIAESQPAYTMVVIPPKDYAAFRTVLSDIYDVNKGARYKINYNVFGFYCDMYGEEGHYLYFSGSVSGILRK